MQRGRGRGVAGGEELERLRLPAFLDLEVRGREARNRSAGPVRDDDAEVDQVDTGAEGLLSRETRRHAIVSTNTSAVRFTEHPRGQKILNALIRMTCVPVLPRASTPRIPYPHSAATRRPNGAGPSAAAPAPV